MAKGPTGRRKKRKNVPAGIAHIQSTFNNTIVTITTSRATSRVVDAGTSGFKGSRKGTPFAAQLAAENAARKAMEHGLRKVEVFVKGPGSGRESAIRSLQTAGLEVNLIRTSPRSRTTGAGRRNGGGCKEALWDGITRRSAGCAAAKA